MNITQYIIGQCKQIALRSSDYIKSDIGAFPGPISEAAHMLAQTATGCLSYVEAICDLLQV